MIHPFTQRDGKPIGSECLFLEMVEIGAYIDAALLIMREVLPEWEWGLLSAKMKNTCALGQKDSDCPSHYGKSMISTPLAIIDAVCVAKEKQIDTD